MSHLEERFAFEVKALNIPEPTREYRFCAYEVGGPGTGVRARLEDAGLRDWRFDFAWPGNRVAVEIEGGTWAKGRHVRGAGYESDCEKYNAATSLGWRVFRLTGNMLDVGSWYEMLEKALR